MDSGLSSGDSSDDSDEVVPEGFEERIKESNGWVDVENTGNIPPITLTHIHSYFVQKRIKKEQITATKPFEKGFRIYKAHKVRTVSLKLVKASPDTYIKLRAAVLPSQRNNCTYAVHIACTTHTGLILHATCTCVAGKCGACNHTAAVMFSVEELNRTRSAAGSHSQPSCTSLPAKWPIPSRTPQTQQPVQDMQVVKPKNGSDPPIPKKRHPPIPLSLAMVTTKRVKELKQDLVNSHDGDLLFHHIWPENIDIVQEQQLQSQINMWSD